MRHASAGSRHAPQARRSLRVSVHASSSARVSSARNIPGLRKSAHSTAAAHSPMARAAPRRSGSSTTRLTISDRNSTAMAKLVSLPTQNANTGKMGHSA